LSSYGINKEVKSGSVDNAKDVNDQRRAAFANRLDEKAEKEARHAVRTFIQEWGKGVAGMVATPKGAAVTAGIGLATGGLGAGAAILGGGFLRAFKSIVGVQGTDAEIVASVRKGEDKYKKLIKELHEIGEKETEALEEARKSHEGGEGSSTSTSGAGEASGGGHSPH